MQYDQLRELYRTTYEARAFLDWLKENEQCYLTLGVGYAEEKTGINYYELVAIFKELDKIGAGEFIVGRKGHDSRFNWKLNTKKLAEAATDEFGTTYLTLPDMLNVPKNAVEAITASKQKNKTDKLKHSFNLRRDFVVDIELPSDFDGGDLSRLKNWLDLLVY